MVLYGVSLGIKFRKRSTKYHPLSLHLLVNPDHNFNPNPNPYTNSNLNPDPPTELILLVRDMSDMMTPRDEWGERIEKVEWGQGGIKLTGVEYYSNSTLTPTLNDFTLTLSRFDHIVRNTAYF